jgi:hypothetical protein
MAEFDEEYDMKTFLCSFAGDLADLIFVFFDPIGQALCKRTLSIVEQLNEKHADRMRFFLSKADDAGPEGDRQVLPNTLFKLRNDSLEGCFSNFLLFHALLIWMPLL